MAGQHTMYPANGQFAPLRTQCGSIGVSSRLPGASRGRHYAFHVAAAIGVAGAITCVPAIGHDGDLDHAFGTQGITIIDFGVSSTPFGLAIAPDGKIILGGFVNAGPATGTDFAVARLTRDGLPDSSFSFDGKTTIAVGDGAAYDNTFNTIVQADARIVVIGQGPDTGTANDDSDFKLVRINTDGTLDRTFSGDGKAYVDFALGVYSDDRGLDGVQLANGKLVIVGSAAVNGEGREDNDFAVARLNTDGSRDTTFHGDGRYTFHFDLDPTYKQEEAFSVAVDASGNILVGGGAEKGAAYSSDFAIARLTPNGTLDPNFGGDGRVTVGFDLGGTEDDTVLELIVAPDGSIFATGAANDTGYDFAVVKLLPDGTPDPSYGTNGKVTIPFDLGGDNNDTAYGASLQADGKLVITGFVETSAIDRTIGLARLDTHGQLDPSFGFAGKKVIDLGINAGALRSRIQDGYLVVGGYANIAPNASSFLAGRIIIDTVFDNGFE